MPPIARRFPLSPPPLPPPLSVQSSSEPAMPSSLPFLAETRHGVPFMVYHVCCVCGRPRSARFHRENPVKEGQILPESTACHRCIEHAPATFMPPPPPPPAPFTVTAYIPPPPASTTHSMYGVTREDIKHSHTSAISAPSTSARAVSHIDSHGNPPIQSQRLEAEKLLKAHPRAFSHGVMEPVSHREERRPTIYQARPIPSPTISGYSEVQITPALRSGGAPSHPYPVQREQYYAPQQHSERIIPLRTNPPAPSLQSEQSDMPFDRPLTRPRSAQREQFCPPHQRYEMNVPLRRNPPTPYQEDHASNYLDEPAARPRPVQREQFYAPHRRHETDMPHRPPPPSVTEWEQSSVRSSHAPSNTKVKKPNVSFASHDHVAVLPPSLPSELSDDMTEGMSRLRRRGRDLDGSAPNDFENYRGRRVEQYVEDEAHKHYEPEPNRALARALSESPSRERLLSITKEHDLAPSYSHGPYRAEVSPSGSMEVMNDSDVGSREELIGPHDEDTWKDLRQKRNEDVYEPGISSLREQDAKTKNLNGDDDEPIWTRYVKVREYRDAEGPYVEVEETIVYDD